MDSTLHRRAISLCVCLVVALSLLSVRLVYLQVVMHEKYAAIAASRYIHKEILPANRGEITDRNGELLARDQTVYTVYVDRNHLKDYNIACRGLAAAEGISSREVSRKYAREEIPQRYVTRLVRVLAHPLDYHGWELAKKLNDTEREIVILKKEVEEDACRVLKELVENEKIGGVHFREATRRYYPSPRTLTQVMGHVNYELMTKEDLLPIVEDEKTADLLARRDITKIIGREGIEKTMDHVLRGEVGYRSTEADRRGDEIAAFRGETKESRNGHSVRLTIDMGLQNIVESALSDAWYQYGPEKISAVFLDPNTGEILAMANRPHFDLTTREGEMRNRAIGDNFEPGSIFKIVTFAGALDRGLVNRHTVIHCHYGSYTDNRIAISDHHPYGDLSVEMILAKSSNIGTYKIAKQLGANSFYEYMRNFGFGDPTGILLTGESSGMVKPPAQWSGTSYSRIPIGYEVHVTPLQMANALAVIANGGHLLKPYVVDAVLDEKGRVIEQFKPESVRRVISERAANEVRKCLMAATGEGGTGTKGCVEGFTVAGKTGTARKYSSQAGGYLSGRYVCSFMGFLPAENPQLLGIIVVDDPQTGSLSRYGGSVAAPIFSAIATEAAAYLNLDPNPGALNLAGRYRGD